MPWQHEQWFVTVQTITLWLYCPPGDVFHYELICNQLSLPQSKPLSLQGNTWYWFQISDKVQPITAPFITHQHFTSSQVLPFSSHEQSGNKRSAWQAKQFLSQGLRKKDHSYTETMPSTEKLLHFLSSSFLCAAGVVLLGYGMSADWAEADMQCAPMDSDDFNGSSSLKIGLFNGTESKISCPRISKFGEKVPGEFQIRLQLNVCMLYYAILHFLV